jgi:glycosyltransferase involved in cell wall biosynthesis
VGQVVHWNIDFVPRRFENPVLERVYRALDRNACLHSDIRLDLNRRALDARTEEYGLQHTGATPMVVPVGLWTDGVPRCGPDAFDSQRLVFLGNLAERQGIFEFVEMVALLVHEHPGLVADVIGGGEIEGEVRARAASLGLSGTVSFHGNVSDPGELAALLAECTIGFAPYRKDPMSFSNYADPSKVKSYLGAGLPIVMSDVPPVAAVLQREGAALVVEPRPRELADATRTLLGDRAAWERCHASAARFADTLDWNLVLDRFFREIGWDPGVPDPVAEPAEGRAPLGTG